VGDLQFLSWDKPFLPAVALALEQRLARDRVLDLGEAVVAVPGARAGRRLLELLVERAAAGGHRLVPPHRILTVGTLPEQLYEPFLPLAGGTLARRCWVQALERAAPSDVGLALGPHAVDVALDARWRFAGLLDALSRNVGAACEGFESVAHACRRGFLFSDEDRWRALARIQSEARSLLAGLEMSDREEARHRALRDGGVGTDRTIVLVGVAEAPAVTRRMLAEVQDRVISFVHAPASEASGFDGMGLVSVEAWQDRRIPVADPDLSLGESPGDQADRVIAFLRGLEGAYAVSQVAVGVPDPSLVPFLSRQLARAGVPSRYAEGTAVGATPPGRLLRAVADFLSEGRFSGLANLVRHPDLPQELGPAWAPELVDEFFGDHLPDLLRVEKGLAGPRVRDLSRLLGTLRDDRFLGALGGEARLSEWMPRVLSLLATVYGPEIPQTDLRHQREVVETLTRIRDVAEELHALPGSLDSECKAHEALRILLEELRGSRIPPEQEEGLEMVGWLELQLDDAPVLVLTGVNDPFLPESVNADLFLPNSLRARLGLEDNRARYARDAYRLTAMLRATEKRLLIAGRRDGGGDPLRPSRLLLTGDKKEMAARILKISGPGSATPTRPRIPDTRESRGSTNRFLLPPEPFIPVASLPRPLPVTAFRALLEDPYVWALRAIRGLRETDHDLQELDAMSFGTLAHRVLEAFARTAEARSADTDAVVKALRGALKRTASAMFGSVSLPTVRLQVEQLSVRLEALAQWQANRFAEGWEIVATEARTPREGVAFDVDGDPVFLSGRIDRIDRHRETGELAVLDYKTGDRSVDLSLARGKGGEWRDLQLPLYGVLLRDPGLEGAPHAEPDRPAPTVRMGYLPLPKAPGPIREVLADWSQDDLASAEEAAREIIRKLRRDGGVAFDPERSGRGSRGWMGALLGQGILQAAEPEQ